MDITIAKLTDELSGLHGPARLPTLARLAQEHARKYWQTGPGMPAALGDLSAAIQAWTEAYDLLDRGDPARGQVAAQLGWLLSARHGAHGSGPDDRNTGIAVLGEALTFSNLPPMLATMARLALGQLHLGRATEALNPAAARGGFLGGMPSSTGADADEAIRRFREVLDGPPASADVVAMTRTMLTLAESIQPLLGGDLARFDISKIMEAMAALQRLQSGGGIPSPASFPWGLGQTGDSLDYPVTVIQGDTHQAPTVPPRRPMPVATVSADPGTARQAARARLAMLVGDSGHPVWAQALALLHTGPEQVAAGDLDAFVGAAANAVDADVDHDPMEAGLDRLLSAVGLCVRERRDGSGWGADDADAGAYLAVADQLDAAADRIPPAHPAAAVVVEALGGLLDDARPLSGAITGIAGRFGRYAEEITPRTAIMTALGALCRTVTAVVAGTAVEPDSLAAAVGVVPADHPWHRTLSTSVGQVRLAAAVRASDPAAVHAAVEGAPGDLAGLLDAWVDDDAAALRRAVDGVTPTPSIAAILGAAILELATRTPNEDDLTAAIRLLSASIPAQDGVLRTRTWWRLAAAYRRRGAAGDAELSRDAGLNALRGAGQDPRSAARFAGWMLAEGRGAEAFTALEVAAAESERPATDPLAEDILSVLLGIAPQVAPPAKAPTPAEVAAAVRTIGAAALLYLHPTDEAGRTAAVLCLDPAADRLDVLANVPVTDPLASDDPGWPAILGRWTTGSLLVAATGDLDRIALPAVRTGDRRRLTQDVIVSHVSSGAQAIALAARPVVPVDAEPLFVVNPRGDRDPEMAEVLVLRRLFYPHSTCLGRGLEPVDAAGTQDDVLARLPGASLAHLACGVRHDGRTELELAGGTVLDATAVRGAAKGGGLVVLAEAGPDGFAAEAEVFLDAGFAGVIGWQRPVPAPFAALALFMAHLMLVDHRMPPASAVSAVQRWMLDPERDLPPFLTGAHLNAVATIDLTRPALWAALAYRGR